jgi:hypothetical protein
MELALHYPTKEAKKVNVGIITSRIIEYLSDQNLLKSGEISGKILSILCRHSEIKEWDDVSFIDAIRITNTSWKMSHGKEVYAKKVYCKCGLLNVVQYDMTEPERLDIFDKEFSFDSFDEDGEKKVYKVRFKPLPIRFQRNMIDYHMSKDVTALVRETLYSRIRSIDGNEEFVRENIPLNLYKQFSSILDKESVIVEKLMGAKCTCPKCQEVSEVYVSMLDATFMQDE